MGHRFNRRTGQYEEVNGLQPINAHAVDTDVGGGLHSGGGDAPAQPGDPKYTSASIALDKKTPASLALRHPTPPAGPRPFGGFGPQVIAGTPAANASALRQASGFTTDATAIPAPIAPYANLPAKVQTGTDFASIGQRALAAAAAASSRGTPQAPVFGKIAQSQPAGMVVGPRETGYFNGQAMNDPNGGSGIYVRGKPVTHDASGALVADVPKPSLDPAVQKGIADQYPEIGNAGSWANKNFVAGLKPGANTAADAQAAFKGFAQPPQVLASSQNPAPFSLADKVPSLNPTPALLARPATSDGYAAGEAARAAAGGAVRTVANGVDSALSTVGSALATGENAVRGLFGAPPADPGSANLAAVDRAASQYTAGNPLSAPASGTSSGNMAGGYDVGAMMAKANHPLAPLSPDELLRRRQAAGAAPGVGGTGGGLTTGGLTTGSLQTGGLTSGGLTTGRLTTGGLTTGKLETGGLTSGGLATGKLETGGLTSGGLATGKLETGGLQTGNLNSGAQVQTPTPKPAPNAVPSAPVAQQAASTAAGSSSPIAPLSVEELKRRMAKGN